MSATAGKKRRLVPPSEDYPVDFPVFETEAEEREFWGTHEITSYWDQLEDVTNTPPTELAEGPGPGESVARRRPKGQKMDLLSMRFPDEMLSGVRQIAEIKHLPYQTLIRSWVGERLEKELAELGMRRETSESTSS